MGRVLGAAARTLCWICRISCPYSALTTWAMETGSVPSWRLIAAITAANCARDHFSIGKSAGTPAHFSTFLIYCEVGLWSEGGAQTLRIWRSVCALNPFGYHASSEAFERIPSAVLLNCFHAPEVDFSSSGLFTGRFPVSNPLDEKS